MNVWIWSNFFLVPDIPKASRMASKLKARLVPKPFFQPGFSASGKMKAERMERHWPLQLSGARVSQFRFRQILPGSEWQAIGNCYVHGVQETEGSRALALGGSVISYPRNYQRCCGILRWNMTKAHSASIRQPEWMQRRKSYPSDDNPKRCQISYGLISFDGQEDDPSDRRDGENARNWNTTTLPLIRNHRHD